VSDGGGARGLLTRVRDELVRRNPDEGTVRRRPSDLVRIAVAAVLLVALSLHAGHPTAAERSVVDWFESLPDDAASLFLILYDAVAVWAVLLLAATILLVRRWRLARDLAIAGVVAWVAGRILAFFVADTDLWEAFTVTFDLTDAPRYPLVRLGMAVAIVVVASPYLTRPTRRVGQTLVVLLALTGMYLGRAHPTDVLAAVVLGWGVAALVHYVLGTPAHRPTERQVTHALEALDLGVTGVTESPDQPVGRAIFLGADADGPLRITALGRDEADAQFLTRAWRYIAYRGANPNFFPTRRQQVEYEAYITLLARDFEVRAPQVIFAGVRGPLALLVERAAEGVILQSADAALVTDTVLDDTWTQAARLHDARIAHGKLDGHHVVIGGTKRTPTTTLVGFEYASTSVRFRETTADVAQLLASTAAVVGNERAVAAAIRGVGTDAVVAALPTLQPQAVSGWTHDAFGGRKVLDDKLEALRVEAARQTRTDPPELQQLYRIHPRSLIMAVAALIAVGTLLSRVGDPEVFWDTIKNADWWYVALAFVLGICTDIAFGITFLGNVPIRLPIWPSIELQSAMSFSNLAVPVAADVALQVRFLQRNGLDVSSAVATGGVLSSVTEIVTQVGLFFLALWLSPDSIEFGNIDTSQVVVIVMIAVFVIGVAMAVLFGIRRLRHRVLPPIKRAAITVWGAIKTPSRLALLIGGNIVAQALYAASLLACLAAFGETVDFWTLLALNIGISMIASLVPVPGGSTAVSAIGLAGMLTAFGVPEAAGSAAVLTHQLAVTYLPAIPGWFATNDLIKKRML
jgi:undecaprenyl-diphosphatase